MQERLDWIAAKPASWLHWEPLLGGLQAHAQLLRRYPQAHAFVAEPEPQRARAVMQTLSRPWWHPARWLGSAPDLRMPDEGEAQMLWANMVLHMAADPQALIARWQRMLAVDGFLMFSCLGPDTLRELRALYRAQGWPTPSHEFTDMHDWGDMLVQAGFAEPVMDMERIELTFETPQRLLQELRELGRNLHPGRFAGLRGRGWHGALLNALDERLAAPTQDGRLKLTFEIIYGHAFKPRPRIPMTAQTVVSLDEMRMNLRQGKGNELLP